MSGYGHALALATCEDHHPAGRKRKRPPLLRGNWAAYCETPGCKWVGDQGIDRDLARELAWFHLGSQRAHVACFGPRCLNCQAYRCDGDCSPVAVAPLRRSA